MGDQLKSYGQFGYTDKMKELASQQACGAHPLERQEQLAGAQPGANQAKGCAPKETGLTTAIVELESAVEGIVRYVRELRAALGISSPMDFPEGCNTQQFPALKDRVAATSDALKGANRDLSRVLEHIDS